MWMSKGCVAALMVALLVRTATGGSELKTMPEAPQQGGTLFVFPDETPPSKEFRWSVFFNGDEVPDPKRGAGQKEELKTIKFESQGPWLKVPRLQPGDYVFVLTGNDGGPDGGKELRWARSFQVESPPPMPPAESAPSTGASVKSVPAGTNAAAKKPYVEQPPVSGRVVSFLADYLAKHQPPGSRPSGTAVMTSPPVTSGTQAVGQKQPQASEAIAVFPDPKVPAKQSQKELEEAQRKMKERQIRETALQGIKLDQLVCHLKELPGDHSQIADGLEELAAEALHHRLTLSEIVDKSKSRRDIGLPPDVIEPLLKEVAIRFDSTRIEEHPYQAVLALTSLAATIRTLQLPMSPRQTENSTPASDAARSSTPQHSQQRQLTPAPCCR